MADTDDEETSLDNSNAVWSTQNVPKSDVITGNGVISLNEDVAVINIADRLSDNEKVVSDTETTLIAKLKANRSIYNRLQGFARLTCGCNSSLLASINEVNGKRVCRIIQQYADGSYSGTFEVNQADLFIAFAYLKYLSQMEVFGVPDDEDSRAMQKKAKKIIESVQAT